MKWILKLLASQLHDKKKSEIKNIRHIINSRFPLTGLSPVHKIVKFDIDNVLCGCGTSKEAVHCEYCEML